MSRRKLSFSLAMLAIVALAATSASAQVLTFQFTGKVTNTIGPLPLYGANPSIGDPISGLLTYDTSVADTDTFSTNFGSYTQSIADGITVHVGGVKFSLSDYRMKVFNDNGGADTFFSQHTGTIDLVSADNVPTSDLGMGVNFNDTTATVFTGDAIPTSIILAAYTSATGSVRDFVADANGNAEIDFSIDTIRLVPEPSTWLLGAMGLFALGITALRRRSIAASMPVFWRP